MKISDKITKQLGTIISGDTQIAPYLSGSDLVKFYNECGFDDIYGSDFPSRWRYSTDKIVESNGTLRLKKILEEFVDPRRYGGDEQVVDKIVAKINQLIKYDGFALIKRGEFYKVEEKQDSLIDHEAVSAVKPVDVSKKSVEYQQKIDYIEELIVQANELDFDDAKIDNISQRAKMIISKFFGCESEYLNTFNSIRFKYGVLEFNISNSTPWQIFLDGKKKLLNLLNVIKEDLLLDANSNTNSQDIDVDTIKQIGANDCMNQIKTVKDVQKTEFPHKVFIVHGHDDALKETVARFLGQLGLEPIILHEKPNSGKTIIEKIEAYTDVGFGVVLYTPCDVGAENAKKANLKNRARQNVVFEHGYLIGKLGRENVAALVKGEIETPNDISGVVYISYENEWKIDLVKELRSSGYQVDMNLIL